MCLMNWNFRVAENGNSQVKYKYLEIVQYI